MRKENKGVEDRRRHAAEVGGGGSKQGIERWKESKRVHQCTVVARRLREQHDTEAGRIQAKEDKPAQLSILTYQEAFAHLLNCLSYQFTIIVLHII